MPLPGPGCEGEERRQSQNQRRCVQCHKSSQNGFLFLNVVNSTKRLQEIDDVFTHLRLSLEHPVIFWVAEHLLEEGRCVNQHVIELALASLQHANSDIRVLTQLRSHDQACSASSNNNIVIFLSKKLLG